MAKSRLTNKINPECNDSWLENVQRVFLEVTNFCNFRCSFCPQAISKRPSEHMDSKLAKSLIKQLYDLGYRNTLYLHLLGEPFLHPEIFDILGFASKQIPKTILFTNGALLTNKNIKSIFNSHPYELMISMQTVDEKSFKFRGSSMTWKRYISGIRKVMEYKLTRSVSTLVRISVGMRKKDTIYPNDNFFPHISPYQLRKNMLKLFTDIPSLNSQETQERINTLEIPFKGFQEIASGISLSLKAMGNWSRIYRKDRIMKGNCPYVGKEFGILSNGNIVLCHDDYDGKTTFANAKHDELLRSLQKNRIEQEIYKFLNEGIVPERCQYCNVPFQHSK